MTTQKTVDWADWVRDQDDPRVANRKPEALDDITVLDLSYKSYAGSLCSSLLAEFGARVIRIEPKEGDFLRTCTPYGMQYRGEGLNSLSEGRNKFHVTLNLETEEGREILKGFVRQADVLLETFSPGVMDGLGLGYEDLKKLNPRLLFGSITPRGQFGPQSNSTMPDYDNVAQARAGIQYATGEMLPPGMSLDEAPWAVPTKTGPWAAWSAAGTFMAMGVLSAIHWRAISGEGQALDVATDEAYIRLDDYMHIWHQGSGHIPERVGGKDHALWLYSFAPTKDGAVFLGGLRLEMWQAFCDIMGKWDEWGVGEWTSLTPFMEPENQEKYFPHLAAFTSQHTGEELVQRSIEYSKSGRLAPITPVIAPIVSPADALKDPNWVERGMFLTVEDPVYGEVVVAQSQYKLTETPIRTKWVCRPVGYDNEFIYNQFLGFGASQIRALKKKGVI